MAGFRAHMVVGMGTGLGISVAGFVSQTLSPVQTGAVFVMGVTGSLLPDLDSDTGKPLSLLFQFLGILLPSIFYSSMIQLLGSSLENLVCYFSLSYVLIVYGVSMLFKRMTVHRGMMHSIPFAVLAGMIAYLLFHPSGRQMAFWAGVAVTAGSLGHLVLDEWHGFTFKWGIIPVYRRSAGSALKFFAKSWWSNGAIYLLLMMTGGVIVWDWLGGLTVQ